MSYDFEVNASGVLCHHTSVESWAKELFFLKGNTMRKTKEQKRVEQLTDEAFSKHGNCISFDVFDLCKITEAGREAGKATPGFDQGAAIEKAVIEAIAKYRKN